MGQSKAPHDFNNNPILNVDWANSSRPASSLISYTPSVPANWTDPDPTLVSGALDDLSARVILNDAKLSSRFLQSASAELTSDYSTASTSAFVDLISLSITTGANYLLIFADCGGRLNQSASAMMIIEVDGTQYAVGTGHGHPGGEAISHLQMSCATRIPVTAASHTVKARVKVTGGTFYCNPVTDADEYGASLVVMEVTA